MKDKFCHRPRLDSSMIDVLLLLMKFLSHIRPKLGKQTGREGKEAVVGWGGGIGGAQSYLMLT